MNKRGQIFLISAIIFVIALYSLIVEYNSVKTYPNTDNYKELSDNYQSEYPKIINFALYNGSNVSEAIDNFTMAFLKDARSKDPNFGVFYMFKDKDGNLYIVNTLNNKALNIQYKNVEGKDVKLGLLSDNIKAEGNLCINGLGCTKTNSFVSDFDSAYYKTQIKSTDINKLSLTLNGFKIKVDISNFTSINYISSSQEVKTGIDQVAVNIKQY